MGLSTGLKWAFTMFGLDLVEMLTLIQILFHDQPRSSLPDTWGWLEVYFIICTVSFVMQFAGILVVQFGWYRTGGAIQIAACVPHLPKGEGLIGLIGGLKAWNFVTQIEAAPAAPPEASDPAQETISVPTPLFE
ncbi:MAG TPA: hypothetical protein VML55_06275 [Planctomycetaceae bacterium]|nr:hypothetical protein [Planctomycetaceae bacterium]